MSPASQADAARVPSPSPLFSLISSPLSHHGLFKLPLSVHLYRRPLLCLAAAIIAGVEFQKLALWGFTLFLLAVALLLILAVLLQRRQMLSAGLAIASAVCFGGMLSALQSPPDSDSLSSFATRAPKPLAVRGLIKSAAIWKPNPNHRRSDPNSQPWLTQWDIQCQAVRNGQQWEEISATSSLTVAGRIDQFLPGDAIEVMGSVRAIGRPTNPGGFDYAEFYRAKSRFVSLHADSISQVRLAEPTSQFPLLRLRAEWVRHVDQSLRRWLPEHVAPLAAALVFGQREQVDWDLQQDLVATGTLHMLAISGLHVEMVAGIVLLIGWVLPVRKSWLLVALVGVCATYAALAGGNPPVLRAVILVAAFALARALNRRSRLSNALGLAALILTLLQVSNVESVGVHLSFVAVAAIGIFSSLQNEAEIAEPSTENSRALQKLISDATPRWQRWVWLGFDRLRQAFLLSLWVWMATCPLIWSNFNILAPIAIPLNVLLAIPLMISLVGGLATGLLGDVAPLGWFAGRACAFGLDSINSLVGVAKGVPLGHVWLPAPATWWVVCFYAIAVAWLIAFGRKQSGWLLMCLVGWIGVGIGPHAFGARGLWMPGVSDLASAVPLTTFNGTSVESIPPSSFAQPELKCTFLDVGHGTSVIIEFPNGKVWLYDAGHLGDVARSHQQIATALWQLPTARIDRLLISHADSDHYNATLGLSKRFRVGSLASTKQFYESSDKDAIELLAQLDKRIVLEQLNASASGIEAEVHWSVLHPQVQWRAASDNAASMCLLLEFAGKRILLPGDLEGTGLLDLVTLPDRPCHVLMAPHHGSLTLDPTGLLQWCQPSVVVISGNHRAARPEVLQKYQFNGNSVAVTFLDGAIQITLDHKGNMSTSHWDGKSFSELGN